jgi:hypothetical protein
MAEFELRRPNGGDFLRGTGLGPYLLLRGDSFPWVDWQQPISQPTQHPGVIMSRKKQYIAASLAGAPIISFDWLPLLPVRVNQPPLVGVPY